MYYLQDQLDFLSGGLAQLILVALLVISIYYAFEAGRLYKLNPFIKFIQFMTVYFTIYGVILIMSGERIMHIGTYEMSNFDYLKSMYISLLPIFPFYCFARRRKLSQKDFFLYIALILLICVLQYFNNYFNVLNATGRTEITNNISYTFIPIIALLCYLKNNTTKMILLIVVMVFVIMGLKRGAIITGGLCMLLFLRYTLRYSSRRQKYVVLLLGAIALLAVSYYTLHFYESSEYFQYRLENTREGSSSGRDEIYLFFLNHFLSENDIVKFLFGNGAFGTNKLFGQFAHNDWLEIAINQGLVGIILYFIYFVIYFKQWRKSKRVGMVHQALGIMGIILLVPSFFSMSIGSLTLASQMGLGYSFAFYDSEMDKRGKMPIYQNRRK